MKKDCWIAAGNQTPPKGSISWFANLVTLAPAQGKKFSLTCRSFSFQWSERTANDNEPVLEWMLCWLTSSLHLQLHSSFFSIESRFSLSFPPSLSPFLLSFLMKRFCFACALISKSPIHHNRKREDPVQPGIKSPGTLQRPGAIFT